ncbi:MAG: lipoyl synthase [Parachlamydiales bacterium]|jgi:lipoic acid synthetase
MTKLPSTLHLPLAACSKAPKTLTLLKKYLLHTVCQEANCPNRLFCFSQQRATFLALGNFCTRACAFCLLGLAKAKNKLPAPDPEEPAKIALCAHKLNLKHLVLTQVTRDDLEDGGAEHLAQIIRAVKKKLPQITSEVLSSDFQGCFSAADKLLKEKITIFNHNLETTSRLTPYLRDPKASYTRSLALLNYVKKQNLCQVKSGLMVGLGEKPGEIKKALEDLKAAGCDLVTIGQYLPPSKKNYPLKEYVSLKQFQEYQNFGRKLGFKKILAFPLARSSLNAEELF